MNKNNDKFTLYDLRVKTIKIKKPFVCNHKEGDFFEVIGENLVFKKRQKFSMYSLSAILPLLPAKQRETHENDWMATDSDIACPDPNCGAVFRIKRIGKRVFSHSEVTVVPLKRSERSSK